MTEHPLTEEEKDRRVLLANFPGDETSRRGVSSEDARRLIAAGYATLAGDVLDLTAKGRAARAWRGDRAP